MSTSSRSSLPDGSRTARQGTRRRYHSLFFLVLIVVSFAGISHAQEPPALMSTVEQIPDSQAVTVRHSPKLLPSSMSPVESLLWGESGAFRAIGLAPLTPEARKSELALRRTMLTIHQIGGFATLGMFVPTLILGQRNLKNYNDAAAGIRPLDRSLNRSHRNIAEITWAMYMSTAGLALLTPPPLIRRDGGNTVTTHKLLAWVHFTGMLAIPFLGSMAAHAHSAQAAKDLRTAHQVVAYTSAAAFAAAMIVITF